MIWDTQNKNRDVDYGTGNVQGQENHSVQGLQVVQVRLVPDRILYSEKEITTAEELYRVVANELRTLDRETFCAVNLSTKNVPISLTFCSVGSLDNTLVSPREVFKGAILSNAASIIIAHNHPSSDCTPSYKDVEATRRLVACGELMGIPVLDHIIVGAYTGKYYSFQEHNFMTDGELIRFLKTVKNRYHSVILRQKKLLRSRNRLPQKQHQKEKRQDDMEEYKYG